MAPHTVLAAVLSQVIEAARAIGLDAERIQADAGIEPALLADPDGRVSFELDVRLWEVLSRQPVGLAIGARLGLEGLGVVGYAMLHGATVGDAFAWLKRFRAVAHPDLVAEAEIRLVHGIRRLVFSHIVPPVFARLREPVEAYAAGLVSSLRGLAGRELRPVAVSLPLERPSDASRHERFFGCPVSWDSPAVEVVFEAAVLDMPVPRANPALFGYLARRAEQLLETLPREASVAERARREIGQLLARGEPRLALVAERLATSERTLHRRLEEEGTTFSALLEAARRERADVLLADRRVSCSEVAFLLGYSDPGRSFGPSNAGRVSRRRPGGRSDGRVLPCDRPARVRGGGVRGPRPLSAGFRT